MVKKIYKWFRKNYNKTVSSIAFYPAFISIGFLLMSIVMLELDFSETGKNIKSQLSWLSLRDASTARSIVATIAGGVISLTVFSFSMVMILLVQAASQMSNRMLDSMIGNRFQQIILGFYIGTIVYALFLLSTIRDISSGIYVPALSIYLLLLFTVADIFLFIYFLHYVTQSVKYNTIIKRIHKQTLKTLQHTCTINKQQTIPFTPAEGIVINMPVSNYYQGFRYNEVLHFAEKHKVVVHVLHPPGTYILKGVGIVKVFGQNVLADDDAKKLLLSFDFYAGQPIDENAYYGFHQLAEVAIKALSPGINDPETAVLSIHSLADLFLYLLNNFYPVAIADENGDDKIFVQQWTFETLFIECIYAIWDYGKNDRYIQNTMRQMIAQLRQCNTNSEIEKVLNNFPLIIQ
jgi:uncharacterized membrane protein